MMYNRRKFMLDAGLLMLGSLALTKNAHAFVSKKYLSPAGLQLFTLFNILDEDVKGNLKKVADNGYKEIESAFSKKGGYYGLKPKEFAALVKDLGMSWKSHHVIGAPFKLPPGAKPPTGPDGKPINIPSMKNLKDNHQELVDEAAEGGVSYLVCSSTPIATLDEVKSSIEVLHKTGEACKKAGLGFAYHNHHQEFQPVEEQIPYDLFLSQTSAETVKMELDLAWAVKGGKDPVALFKQHPGRFPLWHVKDLDAERKTILPVGSGTIDFKRIFDAASIAGMKHYFVEHDMPADPYSSITNSYNYISKMLQA